MKVLALTGASDRCEMALFTGLKQSGVDIEVCGSLSKNFQSELDSVKVPYEPLIFRSKIDFSAIWKVREKLRDSSYQILHAFTGRALSNSLLAAWGKSVKKIAYRGTTGHLSRIDPTSWISFLNPGVDHIVCVSQAVKQYLLQVGIPESRLSVIYKGHKLTWYNGSDEVEPKSADLSQFGIPKDAFVIGSNANMRPVKGIDLLVDAASTLWHAHPDIHYLLVGEDRESRISRLVENSPAKSNIHLAGFRSDAASLMGQVNLFVIPSRSREGLPKALIEAMAQGTASIGTNVGGIPEVIRDGIDGMIVEPNNSQALADAIKSLIENPSVIRTYSNAAKERISSHFTTKKMVEDTLSLYQG